MSKFNWRNGFAFALAITFLATMGWSWSEFSAYQAGHSVEREGAVAHDQANAHGGPYSCRAVMVESGFIDWLACLVESANAESGEQQAYYDLKAQQDMAAWAFGMLIVTIWLSVITLFGVGFVWRTLVETKKMAGVTREIGQAQVRAYLSFDSVQAVFITSGGGECTAIRFRPYIKNTGQTPAHIRVTYSEVVCYGVKPSEIEVTPVNKPANMRVGSQKPIFLGGDSMDWESVRNAIDSDLHMVLICGVEFEDVFFQPGDERRIEDFAVRVVFNGRLADPRKPYKEQPAVEWHDLQLNVSRASPPEKSEEQ